MRFGPMLFRPARFNQNENIVPFTEVLPLQLKERVSGKGDKTSEVSCLHEMSILFACLKKSEFDQNICAKEIGSFQQCYTANLTKKRVKKDQEMKGILTPGQRSLTHKQVNQMLKRFPNIK